MVSVAIFKRQKNSKEILFIGFVGLMVL
jgi:hypothetical protein